MNATARRSRRIGQEEVLRAYCVGYRGSAQTQCLALMAKKIAVVYSTSGEMPESGLNLIGRYGESICSRRSSL